MFNQVIITGHLGADPESRTVGNGSTVTNLRVASSRTWYDAKGDKREKVTWVRVAVWGGQAAPCAKYLKKGDPVQIVGELEEPNAFLNKAGDLSASNEVTARQVIFLPKGGGSDTPASVEDEVPSIDPEDFPF